MSKASVTVKVIGGEKKIIEAATVGEAKQMMGVPSYVATLNGSPASDSQELKEDDFLSLAAPVKGGC